MPLSATGCTHLRATERHRAVSLRDAACRLPPATAFHRVPLSATVRCKAPPSATIRATARRRVLPSTAECQTRPTDMSTTARQRVARCIRSATACLHKAARHRLPLRGTARATGGCRASLRAMESRVECHRVPPIAIKCHQVHTLRARAPPSATERCHCVPLRANAFHRVPPSATCNRVAPSGTEAFERHGTFNLCIEWRTVLQCYRAPPGAAVCCAASHANQCRSNADLRWSAARAQPADF